MTVELPCLQCFGRGYEVITSIDGNHWRLCRLCFGRGTMSHQAPMLIGTVAYVHEAEIKEVPK